MRELGDILWIVVPLMALACFGLCALRMFRSGRGAGRWRCCGRPGTRGPGDVTGR